MSRRSIIPRKHLSLLRVYFRKTGWTLLEPVGPTEVFRANRLDHKRPIVVYKTLNSDKFAINERDYRIFEKFLKWLEANDVDLNKGAQKGRGVRNDA